MAMILSGRDIQWYIQQKMLVITPIEEEQFRQNGIDLILEDVRLPQQINSRYRPSQFETGKFYLGATREHIELPNDLMAFVELRSTWARRGIMLPPTIVDAGFKGNLTLEIAAFSSYRVPYGERFGHLIFAKMSSPSEPYNGKYQGQSGITAGKQD